MLTQGDYTEYFIEKCEDRFSNTAVGVSPTVCSFTSLLYQSVQAKSHPVGDVGGIHNIFSAQNLNIKPIQQNQLCYAEKYPTDYFDSMYVLLHMLVIMVMLFKVYPLPSFIIHSQASSTGTLCTICYTIYHTE